MVICLGNPMDSRSLGRLPCPGGSAEFPSELRLPHLGVRPCPPVAAWCRESVPRLCPRRVPQSAFVSRATIAPVRANVPAEGAHWIRRTTEVLAPSSGEQSSAPRWRRRLSPLTRSITLFVITPTISKSKATAPRTVALTRNEPHAAPCRMAAAIRAGAWATRHDG